ncbi:MAG: sodium-dependent transporter [Planctomycetota bacterium]|jgi:NSS family neurotransmitter:Na+ symporter
MAETLLEEQRENWGTRTGFVLAAIGSAVGLGNLWGFPYKLYSYGGGAFLIPYVIAMLLIGIPLLIAEFSLGHITQRATPDAFGRANRKFGFVGWWQIILSFIIITYYAVILAYCVNFLAYSIQGVFTGSLPWAGKGLEGVHKAKDFFNKDYLAKHEAFSLGAIQWHIVASLVITWLAMYFCIFRGIRLVGKVVMWTVPLPWLMLLMLTIRGMTLQGSIQGLEYYLEPSWAKLADPATWRWAFGQMFFSMSLAFGIMITYASFLHRKSDLNNNAAVIGLADMGTSFVAGLAVFATLGGMAFASAAAGAPVPIEKVVDKGPGLAFVAFPYALAQLPHAAWFSMLFFASLLLLGIDSAFSITESVLASIVDKTGWHRGKTLIGLSIVGLVIGLVFCTQGGLNWLGTLDGFINGTWGITLTALLECVVLGWLFRLRRLREHANERSDWRVGAWWDWCIRLVIPVALAALFAWSLFDSVSNPGGYVFKYKPKEIAVTVPAAQKLPARPVLEVRFVADFSGNAEHTFTLDETKAKETHKPWTVVQGSDASKLGEDFKAADLAGKTIVLTTDTLTPRTAYTAQYRWNSLPQKDPRTGLGIPVPEDKQPKWRELTKLMTTSKCSGVNIGNTIGLCLMAAAPVLAIIITGLRFRRGGGAKETMTLPYADDRPRGRAIGALANVLTLAAFAGCAAAFMHMLTGATDLRAGVSLDTTVDMTAAPMFLAGATIAALFALLLGGILTSRLERSQVKASMALRLSAGGGIFALGICGGLVLALVMLTARFPAGEPRYDNELSGTGYVILGVMLGLIVVGLGWCFLRAVRVTGAPEAAEQLGKDVNGE